MKHATTLQYAGVLLLAAASSEAAEPPPQKVLHAVRVADAPVVDGKLDDAVWQQATPISDFHQIRPGDGTAPSEPTLVYVVYTDDALYIGARMDDREPDLIAHPTIRHGVGLGGDDRLVVILDPFNTKRTGYRFETNLNAVRHDALYQSVSAFSGDWNTIWDTAAWRYDNGWSAELEIPFKSLPFDPNSADWGFNFGRGIRRKGEEMAWVSYNRSYNPSISGTLSGISGINQGVGLDVVPSFSVTQQKRHQAGTSDLLNQPSLDAFYRLTPSLNAALTINTDFSATEVDNRQVNLTRFNLFFPEKRDFFLNDSDLFQFGSIGAGGNNSNLPGSRPSQENARPYFSRRIGLGAGGNPVDIEYGGRISGRVGRWNIGTLAIRQGEAGAVDAATLLVSRISANVLQESNLGFILTDGDPASNRDNTVFGVDFRYLNTRLASGRQIEGDMWYQQSSTPGLDGDDAAWGLGLRSPNNTGLRSGIGIKEVQRNFNPAMGYVNRAGIRDYTLDLGYTHFFGGELLQTGFSGLQIQRIDELGGGLQSEEVALTLLQLETNTRDRASIGINRLREVVTEPFTLYQEPGKVVMVQPGDYRFDEVEMEFGTGNQRRFAAGLDFTRGEFYDGDRTNIGLNFNWNASRWLQMSLNHDWNDIELPQGDFITRLSSINSQVAFSSTLFWITLLQYDNVSEEVGINTRLQWIPEAGQEGFIVLNYALEDRDKDNTFRSASSDISIKFKYTFRY